MKRLVLREMVETADAFEIGEVVAQVFLTPGGPRVQAVSADVRERIEAVLAEPLVLRGGGAALISTARPVRPEDGDDFLRALAERLEKRDMRLAGSAEE